MNKILQGDATTILKTLESNSVQTCITSPPYFGLRDYGMPAQMGLEDTPQAYVQNLMLMFREVRRVLKKNGTLWLNLGDSYSHGGGGSKDTTRWPKQANNGHTPLKAKTKSGLKPKDLIGIPWRVAFAMQADGWYLRQEIIWAKPNPMPESVTDRCTKAHEYIFLLSKSPTYYYDAKAIKTPWVQRPNDIRRSLEGNPKYNGKHKDGYNGNTTDGGVIGNALEGANKRSVWTVNTKPYSGAHFATFPEELIEPMVLAGSAGGGVVLDPFMGAGTTAVVAQKLGRQYLGIELNPDYIEIAQARIATAPVPLFS